MNVHVLQHVRFEDAGSIARWLERQKATVTYTRFYEQNLLPNLDTLDLLVIMGGPMSVHDELSLPWLRPEKEFLRQTIVRKIPTLGVCLGAQLIADVLGARVYRNAHKEVGWFPITTAASNGTFKLPEQLEVFHWHGETFNLPAGAVLLASSEACRNQAFQIGRHVIGLQFHLEVTPGNVQALVNNCRDEIIPGPYIQTEQELLRENPAAYERLNRTMDSLLSYLTGMSTTGAA